MITMSPHVNYRILLLLFFAAFMINMFSYLWTLNNTPKYQFTPYSHRKMRSEILLEDPIREATRPRDTFKQHLPEISTATINEEEVSTTNGRRDRHYDPYEVLETVSTINFASNDMDMCPELPPNLGVMPLLEEVVTAVTTPPFTDLQLGGRYKPDDCKARQRVAVIMPIRDIKNQHLTSSLQYLHLFLMQQQLDYQIFLVENVNKSAPFVRALLYNVGFKEALVEARRYGPWDCVIFHEPYLLPLDSRNLYRCGSYPKQLVTQVNKDRTYDHKIGGAIAIRPEQFKAIHGFQNILIDGKINTSCYDELLKRIEAMMYIVETVPDNVGKYYRSMINIIHNKTESIPRMEMTDYVPTTAIPRPDGGALNLSYRTVNIHSAKLYTLISVAIDVIPDDAVTVSGTGFRSRTGNVEIRRPSLYESRGSLPWVFTYRKFH